MRKPAFQRFVLVPLVILALGVAVFGYQVATRIEARPQPPAEQVWPVRAVEVAIGDHQPQLHAYGEAVASRHIELRPQVSGRLVEVSERLVDGSRVAAGTLLARVDPFEYETAVAEAEAGVAEAEARLGELRAQLAAEQRLLAGAEQELTLRERDFERARSLSERGTGSARARDEAELALIAARRARLERRQALERLQAQIEQQQAALARSEAQLARARRDLRDTALRAPFTGFLSEVNAALGQRVRDGDRLGRLVAAEGLEVRFQLSARQASGLLGKPDEALIGRPVVARWRVGDQRFDYGGRVARVGAEIDATSGGIQVHAVLEQLQGDDPLRPGAFVEVSIPDRLYRKVARIPAAAVSGGNHVYVIEDGRLALREISVHRRVGEDMLVSGELGDGDRLVTTLFPEAGPGARVSTGE